MPPLLIMGWFDSEYVYTAYSFTQPLFKATTGEAMQKKVIVEAILESSDSRSISDGLLKDIYNNRGQKIVSTFAYLMSSHPHLVDDMEYGGGGYTYDQNQYESYLAGVEGEAVTIVDINYGALSFSTQTVYYYLQQKHSYNSFTGIVTGTPLNDQYGTVTVNGTPTMTFPTGTIDASKAVVRIPLLAGGQSHSWDIPIKKLDDVIPPRTGLDSFLWLAYTFPADLTRGKKWLMALMKDLPLTPPEFTNASLVPVGTLPPIYFRLNNKDISADPTAANHASYVAYARQLGFNYTEIGEEVNNQEGQPSNQVANNISLEIGVSLMDHGREAVQYMMDYFIGLKTGSAGFLIHNKQEFLDIYNQRGELSFGRSPPPASTKIGTDNEYRINYIDQRTVTGTIGANGTTAVITTPGVQVSWSDPWPEKVDTGSITFRRQIAANLIQEVEVGGYAHANGVGKSKGGHQYLVRHFISDVIEDNSNELLVPLDVDIVKLMPARYRKVIAQNAYYLRVEGYTETELKWYQTEGFANFVEFVGAILFVTGLGDTTKAFLELVSTYGLVKAVILVVVIGKVIDLALAELYDLLVQLIGEEYALIFYIAVQVALAVYGKTTDLGKMEATVLLHVQNGLKAGPTTYNEEQLAEFMKQQERLASEAEQLQEELERAQSELLPAIEIDPMILARVDPFFIPGEVPEEYFVRTVHASNVGIFGVDAVHNYVKMALTLDKTPKFDSNQ